MLGIKFYFRNYAEKDTTIKLYLRLADFKEYKKSGILPLPDVNSLVLKTTDGDSLTNMDIVPRYAGKYKKVTLRVKKGGYFTYYKSFIIRKGINLNCTDMKEIKVEGRELYSFDLQSK